MWICDEEIGSRCGKNDDVILKIFRRDVADGQSDSLGNRMIEGAGGKETSATHSLERSGE